MLVVVVFSESINTLTMGNKNRSSDLLVLYTQRQKRLNDFCLTHPNGSVRRIYLHEDRSLSYCSVPKAGCTFWINVFRFLYNETGGVKVKHPNEIPRMITHYGKSIKAKPYTLKDAEKVLPHTLRFFFSREPYSRLWSAYVDKFILPDYWCTEGRRIVNRRNKHGSSPDPKSCAKDISFREFLNHVATSSVDSLDDHWCPVSYMCDPCNFRPDVIGAMETFAKDSHFVLSQVNLGYLLDNYDKRQHIEDEMAMLTDYNFALMNRSYCKHCTTPDDIAVRLWKTFKINGYLSLDSELPPEKLKGINAKSFMAIARETYRKRPNSWEEVKVQRRNALIDAYKSVPPSTMNQLKSMYETDFLMFNYESSPSWLKFNTSVSPSRTR